jgi:protein-S-isoprenylcysteine O-methyltransferase
MLPVPFDGHPFYCGLFIITAVGWLLFEQYTGRSRKSSDPSKASDRGSFRLLVLMIWLGTGLDYLFAFTLPQAAIPCMRTQLFLTGIATMWTGIAFRYYAMRVLGRYFTFDVAIHSGQSVIEAGPYRYIRHPSYSGAILTQLGLGLALGNGAGFIAIIVCAAIGFGYRIHVEESALVAALGEPYKKYIWAARADSSLSFFSVCREAR